MDSLLDSHPIARKPKPKFGYVPSAPPAQPEPIELAIGLRVLYVGPEAQKVFAGMSDIGIIMDGPQTAATLGIPLPGSTVFWDVEWANRMEKRRCWTPATSLKIT